jgi:methionyl aminopeptidase
MSIPNVSNIINDDKLNSGDVIAIEPFATNGLGHVISGNGSNIYLTTQTIKSKLVRDKKSIMLFNKLKRKFKTLPFSPRWCGDISNNIDTLLKRLTFLGFIKHYPQLVEKNNGIVTQKEHTVIINKDECDVITK